MVPKKVPPNPSRAPPRRQGERVTVRLSAQDLMLMDNLIYIGEFNTRSDVIKRAIRDLAYAQAGKVEEYQKKMETLAKLGALGKQSFEAMQK